MWMETTMTTIRATLMTLVAALTLGCDLGRERRSASGGLSLPYGASTASCYGQFVVG